MRALYRIGIAKEVLDAAEMFSGTAGKIEEAGNQDVVKDSSNWRTGF